MDNIVFSQRNIKPLIALIIYSCFCSVVSISKATDYYSAENVHKFAEYLYQEGDYVRSAKEYERYLRNSPQEVDETLFRIGLCYRHAGDAQKAIDFFQRITKEYPQSDFKFSANYQISYTYFLSGQYKESIGYIEQVLKETEGEKRQKLETLLALNYLNQRQWRSASNLLDSVKMPLEDKVTENIILELKDRSQEGINLKPKSRLLASLMSAILPGTGKIYSKQFGNGIFSLVLVGTTGLLAWDGFRENGIHSVRGWIFGSLCSIFYTGNIYGSGISALAYNRQAETDIIMRLPSLSDE
jgi:tetratricopeptide (TPR) repeat protein